MGHYAAYIGCIHRRFGKTYLPALRMGPTGCPEISVSSNLQRKKSQKSEYFVTYPPKPQSKLVWTVILLWTNSLFRFRFLWPCIVSKVWREKNQQDATIRCLLLTSVSRCFGHNYAHLQEIKGLVTAFGVYWSGFDGCGWQRVVGRCLVGCEHYEGFCWTETFIVLTSCKTAPHNRYQPHPTKPDQYTTNAVTGSLLNFIFGHASDLYWCLSNQLFALFSLSF